MHAGLLFWLFPGLMREGVEGDLDGVEDLAALFRRDGTDEDSVGCAGEELAHAIVTGEDGHGVPVGFPGFIGGKASFNAVIFRGLFHKSIEGALPGGAAAAESGLGVGGVGCGTWLQGCGSQIGSEGNLEDAFFEGFLGHGKFSWE